MTTASDEFDDRVRSLDAERLRPTPPRPADEFRRRLEEFETYLAQLGEDHYSTKEAGS